MFFQIWFLRKMLVNRLKEEEENSSSKINKHLNFYNSLRV